MSTYKDTYSHWGSRRNRTIPFRIVMVFWLIAFSNGPMAFAQLTAGKDGLFVSPGTILSSEGLYLVPLEAFTIKENALSKRNLSVSGSALNGVKKIYEFSSPIPFNGSLGFFYFQDELNGNQPEGLRLAYSTQVSTNYNEFSVIDEPDHDRKMGLLTHNQLRIPTLSSLTALTPAIAELPNGKVEASNFLTPNQDGLNDLWLIKGIENYPLNELKIYDRSGRLIYNTTNYNNSWDGTYNGRPLAEDSYYYVLYLIKEQKQLTGFISIVKQE